MSAVSISFSQRYFYCQIVGTAPKFRSSGSAQVPVVRKPYAYIYTQTLYRIHPHL
jgi:hypothetical protein